MNNIQNNKKLVDELYKAITTSNTKKVYKCAQKTEDFIYKLSNSTTEMIKTFLAKNTNEIPLRDKQSKLYQYDNLLIAISNGRNAYNLEQTLKYTENKGIAPRYIEYFELGNGEFLSVLEGDSETLIPYKRGIENISNSSKQSFKTALKKMVNEGLVNKELFANKEPLFIAKDTQNIVYADWENLSVVSPEMKQYYLEQIDKFAI